MIDVPRCDSVPFQEPPLTWRPYRRQDGTRGALFTCPEGHTASLEGWTIAADGAVSPSVDCTPNGCSFHDYVRLVDWEGPWCPCRVHGDPDGDCACRPADDDGATMGGWATNQAACCGDPGDCGERCA